jgi:hypothetical protein
MLTRSFTGAARRRGAVLLWFLITAPVLLGAFLLAVQLASLRHRQVELQIVADAAALAAADVVASDDRLLTDLPSRHVPAIQDGRDAALRYGRFNYVWGDPLQLDPNPGNDRMGELVFGTLDHPGSQSFDITLYPPPDGSSPRLNAVRVAVRRGGAAASATALIDRDVIGFKLHGTQTLPGRTRPALPLVPLAIRTDPCPPGACTPAVCMHKDHGSWEYQVCARQGGDAWTVSPQTGRPLPGADHIPEITVVFSSAAHAAKVNGQIIAIGAGPSTDAFRQLQSGLTMDDLQQRGGQLLLNDGLGLQAPDNRLVLPQLALASRDMDQLALSLRALIGEPRIWMLYELQGARSDQTVLVRGFVAARIVNVQTKTGAKSGDTTATQVEVLLQPCQLTTAAAVTDRSRRDLGPRSLFNPYISRVRLVE